MLCQTRCRRHDEIVGWLCAILVLPGMAAVRADAGHDVRSFLSYGAGGIDVVRECGSSSFVAASPAAGGVVDGGGVIWTKNLTDAIYTSTEILIPSGELVAGTWLNPPQHVELDLLEGTGTPTWTFPLTDVEVAASRNGDVVAAVDSVGTTVTVHKWQAASATPDWSLALTSSTPGSHRAVGVSPDGSTIAVLVTKQGMPNRARLYIFDAASSTPVAVIDGDDNTFGRNLAMSADGAYVAFMGGARIYVADRDAATLRFNASAGASNDAVALTGDGQFLAYGWTTLFVAEWDGSTYAPRWTRSHSGSFVTKCVASSDSSTLVTGWASFSFLQNKIERHDPASSTPTWTYDYALGSGSLQDTVGEVAVTADGSHVAVASWGDQANTNPEIHVFDGATGAPVLTVDTPGTMFDVDIAAAPNGTVYVTAGGKHIHANISGRGGDLYSIRLGARCVGDVNGDGVVDVLDLLELLANWGPCPGCPADLNGDGVVDVLDLLELLAAWGPC